MKGAKINIRTSLTRKLVNKSLSSPVIKLNDSQLNSSQLSEACDSERKSSLLVSPESSKPFCGTSQIKKEDPPELIPGFKPKIVQHQATHKQPFSLSMARQRIATRQVDIQWLDGCLVEDGCSVPSKPEVYDDQDVIYSTDDEAPKPRKITTAASQTKVDQVTSPPIPKKRKYDEEQISECSQKKPKMDESLILQENGFGHENVPSTSENTSADKQIKYAKENSTTAAKRERLEKYYSLFDPILFRCILMIIPFITVKWRQVQQIRIT